MLADKQLLNNIEAGGIIGFDCDNLEIDCFHEESHQIHLVRPLSQAEFEVLDSFADFDYCYDGNNPDSWSGERWLNCMALSEEVRAYLLSLKA